MKPHLASWQEKSVIFYEIAMPQYVSVVEEKGEVAWQVDDGMLLGILEESAVQIYAGIQARLDNAAECDAVQVMLEDSACVWAGRGFVPADTALVSPDRDCTPYLHRVPDVVAPYKQLLRFLGVRCCLNPFPVFTEAYELHS
jgi:hypothetical protein